MSTRVEHKESDSQKSFSYVELVFDSWNELKAYLLNFREENPQGGYVFRGHANDDWELKPTIDRLDSVDAIATEKKALEDFKKDIAIFAGAKDVSILNTPNTDLKWLALMQHHGAATRLLDFSDSPFIATFFSMASTNSAGKDKCIWAIPLLTIDKTNFRFNVNRAKTLSMIYEEFRVDRSQNLDILGHSYLDRQFERLFRQQGDFLYSLSSAKPFSALLHNYFNDESLWNDFPLLKLTLKNVGKETIGQAVRDLKSMNITYSSLFPDIDGFSKDILISEYIGNDFTA